MLETAVSGGEEEESGGGAIRMNDGENTGAIVAGTVIPFILLVTVSAVILVCWRWYAHSQCYFSYKHSPFRRYARCSASIPNVSSITCKPMHSY